ncbi:MAG TPA: hypothetical protein ENK44_09850 [Caldithrix abyssi]|uniref:Uncharacterized protein n=1 Tax=Caldithrix abyssi TaxID=187145 RepID=A0A7V4U0Z0_CALAY|nr:hypothetical protein [Caldithrix abyssi]
MSKFTKIVNLIIAFLFALSITSCGWKASEEEIKQLEETKAAALAAEKTFADKQAERSKLESDLKTKKDELAKLKSDRDKVLKRVAEMKTTESE